MRCSTVVLAEAVASGVDIGAKEDVAEDPPPAGEPLPASSRRPNSHR